MAYSNDSKSAAVRAHLDHPVIDGDGHLFEDLEAISKRMPDVYKDRTQTFGP